MAATTTTRDDALALDLPAEREYESDVDNDLDAALVEAIKRARDADNTYLETVLRNELKSHYYGCQFDS